MSEITRAGFVALIGEPNAGKSTLLNRMVGAKVSIVTHKVQTTRTRIRGIAMEGAAQIVTPYAPVGPVATRLGTLSRLSVAHDINLVRVLRDHDRQAWPHATHGFFRFREAVMA